MASHTDRLFSAPNLPNGPELKKAVAITIKKAQECFLCGNSSLIRREGGRPNVGGRGGRTKNSFSQADRIQVSFGQRNRQQPTSYFGNQYLPNSDISRENSSLLFPHARDAKPKYLNLNNKGGSPAAPSAEVEFILVPLGALLEIRKMRIRVTHFCGSRKREREGSLS